MTENGAGVSDLSLIRLPGVNCIPPNRLSQARRLTCYAGIVLLLVSVLPYACGQQPQEPADAEEETHEAPAGTEVRSGEGSDSTREAADEQTEGTAEPPAGDGETDASSPTGVIREPAYGYTYGRATGNRTVGGSGNLPVSEPVDIKLGGVPGWVVGAPMGDDMIWAVALEGGRIEAFRLDGDTGRSEPWPVSPDRLPAGSPPAVVVEGESLEVIGASRQGASDATHPIPVSNGRGSLFVARDGRPFVRREGRITRVGDPRVRALPDARPVRSRDGPIAVLTDPTLRYAHGVLGDNLEAGSITLLEPSGSGVAGRVEPESGGVFEAVAPLWFEGPDGEQLLAVTESAQGVGSRISVYRPDGTLVAAGPFFGEPQRWRHLLAAGPFGPNGELEIAATRTPHIGGVVEFYAVAASGELELTAARPGYATHRIYTRNLDTARAGDLDGDGRWELLVPDQTYTELGAVRRERGGAKVAWTLPAGGVLTTNLASAQDSEGRVFVAAGREDGVLRIWR